jgi:hypothetical protein
MERRNPCVFRRFRTLSIAMGVYTPSFTQSVLREGPLSIEHARRAAAIPWRTCTEGQSDALGEYRTCKKSEGDADVA